MNTCETCAHWQPLEEWDVKAGGLRRCVGVRQRWDVEDEIPEEIRASKYDGAPLDAAYQSAAEAVFAEARAVVQDGSQYSAQLLTRPDFGCVLWTEGTHPAMSEPEKWIANKFADKLSGKTGESGGPGIIGGEE